MKTELRGILLVEDEEHDVFFMRRAMTKAGLPPPVHVATNGQDAVDYLSGAGEYSDREKFPLPTCTFLDLKLPFIHGFEVLEWVRMQPDLQKVCVFILSASAEESDRRRAAELGATGYLVKPPTPRMLLDALQLVPSCLPIGHPMVADERSR